MKPLTFLIAFVIFSLTVNPVYSQAVETESGMKWFSLEEAQLKAKEEGKKVLIFGYADWCTYCRKMRKEVYPDSNVQKTIDEYYYPVQLNTESEAKVKFNGTEILEAELAAYLRLTSLPTHYFIDEDGEILGAQPGFLPSEVFKPMLNFVGTGAFSKMEFEEYLESEN